MKVVSIEIAEAIENEIAKFLEENGEAGSMRFTRFIDLGGKQVELFLYPPQMGASVWGIINAKAVFKTEEGDCVIYSVKIPSLEKGFEDVIVNPERAKLPAMIERILKFLKEDLLQKSKEKGTALEGGGLALESDSNGKPELDKKEGASGEDETPLEEISDAEAEEASADEKQEKDEAEKKED
jgi:hypothetical protein